MRKLATIRKVKEIIPIDGADNIEVARVDGWKCVVKKGEFKTGDYGVYFEVDSFLPESDKRYEFLMNKGVKTMEDGSRGHRLRTIKLKGQIAQGLLLPLKKFPELKGLVIFDDYSGMNISDLLNIKLYEPPIPANLSGKVKGAFPGWIRKTDQERIQNLPEYFELYKDISFEITEKLDGSSMTVYYRDGDFGVCSRNLDLLEDDHNTLWKVVRQLELEEKMKSLGKNIAIQGELVGEGIQKNHYHIKGQQFFVFDIWDIDKQRYFTNEERYNVVENFKLLHVPFLLVKDLLKESMENVIELADGKSELIKSKREGIVAKSIETVDGQIISFKVLNNNHLLQDVDEF